MDKNARKVALTSSCREVVLTQPTLWQVLFPAADTLADDAASDEKPPAESVPALPCPGLSLALEPSAASVAAPPCSGQLLPSELAA